MTRRPGRTAALVGLIVAVAVAALGPAPAGAGEPRAGEPGKVLVVTLPRVTWDQLDRSLTPELWEFLDGAAVASLSTRTVGPRTDSAGAYLTIGAGNRADSLDPASAGEAANAAESTPAGPAAAVFQRRTGEVPSGEVLALSMPEQVTRNEDLLYGAVPGSLARALGEDGRTTGVVGNADETLVDGVRRDVALAAADSSGQVAVGNVGSSLLVADETAPFGIRLDPAAYLASVGEAWRTATVVVAELSDLERAEQARAQSTAEQGDAQFRRALQDSDALFGALLSKVDLDSDLVMVVAPTAPLEKEQLTVFGMRGPGLDRGWSQSPTTRRDGFITLTDLAPTILARLGLERPDAMNDTPASTTASDASLQDRVDAMVRANERAVFRDQATGPVTVGFILLLVILLLLVTWCISRRNDWAPQLEVLALVVMAVPSVAYLSGLAPYGPFVPASFGLAILAGSVLVALVARTGRRVDPLVPPLLLAGLCVGVLAVDIVAGGGLQLNTVFGYSPIVAGRFAGYGNQAFSLLTISTLVVATAGWELWGRLRPATVGRGRTVVLVVFLSAVVVLDGAPMFGADVGGVLASVPAFAVCTLLLSGRRIRLRLVALIGVGTVAVLVAFALLDLSRPPESRTHLGRFAAKVADGDMAVILQRKLEANISILTSTVWTLVIPAALLFLAYLTWRPNRMLRRINERHLSFRAFGISGLTLGIVAWVLNDSGVAIPAMMLTVALPYTAYLVLDTLRSPEATRRSGDTALVEA